MERERRHADPEGVVSLLKDAIRECDDVEAPVLSLGTWLEHLPWLQEMPESFQRVFTHPMHRASLSRQLACTIERIHNVPVPAFPDNDEAVAGILALALYCSSFCRPLNDGMWHEGLATDTAAHQGAREAMQPLFQQITKAARWMPPTKECAVGYCPFPYEMDFAVGDYITTKSPLTLSRNAQRAPTRGSVSPSLKHYSLFGAIVLLTSRSAHLQWMRRKLSYRSGLAFKSPTSCHASWCLRYPPPHAL